MKYVSLYSGVGGLDYGFNYLEYELKFANDFHLDSCKTFSKYFDHEILNDDLNNVLNKVPKADLLIGGPPCQSFSLLGKRRPDDDRGKEVFNYLKVVEKMNPKIFIFENVPGISSSIIDDVKLIDFLKISFEKLGYNVHLFKFDCTEYFIPQTRKRHIFFGWKNSVKAPKLPSLAEIRSTLKLPKDYVDTKVKDAISDLPYPKKQQDNLEYKKVPQSPYQKFMRLNSKNISLHTKFHMSPSDKQYIEHIPPGGNYMNIPDSIASNRVKRIKKTGGRTTTYGRLHPNKYSATINTYFNRPNVGTNYHYSQKRLITPREAMRIQSFPDDFNIEFKSIRSLCMQIGNAVPPFLSIVLALMVKEMND